MMVPDAVQRTGSRESGYGQDTRAECFIDWTVKETVVAYL